MPEPHLQSEYSTESLNDPVLLYQGHGEVRAAESSAKGDLRITLDWYPSPREQEARRWVSGLDGLGTDRWSVMTS